MKDEQADKLLQQLIKTPAGERIRMKCGTADLRSVITDALSLLDSDSQAAGDRTLRDQESLYPKRDDDWALRELADGWIQNNEREGPYGFNQNARRVLGFVTDDAATAMREKCVAKVKGLPTTTYDYRGNVPDSAEGFKQRAVAALESLTLDQVKPGEM